METKKKDHHWVVITPTEVTAAAAADECGTSECRVRRQAQIAYHKRTLQHEDGTQGNLASKYNTPNQTWGPGLMPVDRLGDPKLGGDSSTQGEIPNGSTGFLDVVGADRPKSFLTFSGTS